MAWAEVEASGLVVGWIDRGLLVYLGVGVGDEAADADWLAEKIASLRIFEDDDGKLNFSGRDARGGVLAIPNFTLLAEAGRGRRPSFSAAETGGRAGALFKRFVSTMETLLDPVAAGVFGETMIVRSAADGPVNILLDTRELPARQACGASEVTSETDNPG